MLRTIVACTLLAFPSNAQTETISADEAEAFLLAQSFSCSRKTCSQMRSCAEACHALLVCGDRRRDGDNDGIPCENICSRRC